MTTNADNSLVDPWLDALGYKMTGNCLLTPSSDIGQRPYATELKDLLDPEGSFQCAAVFLVDDTPTVCFRGGDSKNDRDDIDAVRQRLWNQNLISALLVCDEASLNAFAIPKLDDVPVTEVVAKADSRADGKWSAVEVQSSDVQQRLIDWFDPTRRVDRQLIRQLGNAVSTLTKGRIPLIASATQAKMLLAQIMFVSYLEHRGIAGDDYRKSHELGKLHDLVRGGDGVGIDRLIHQLKEDFNGDFLEPDEICWNGLSKQVLTTVDEFLSRVDIKTGQRDFWNYDFSQIPVELLSGIYEIFLEGDRKVDGAYYTPRVLAELTVHQAFSQVSAYRGLRVYDGACGSGILLTTAFRRMMSYEEASLKRHLSIRERIDLLQSAIFGGDINPIACRVTAFSLYLCLLENLAPADLVRLQEDEECKLPQLIGVNIMQGPDGGDFFSSKNALATSRSFDIVISNPPWRELAVNEAPNATSWAADARVHLPHRQIAAAYALKCTGALKQGGRLVLILPTSLISAPSNEPFLKQLTVNVQIERLINLSDFRRILFAKAEHACTILLARNIPGLIDKRIDGHFEYWTPKADISFALNRLTLHDYDRVQLSRASLIAGNGHLRRNFWGNKRDNGLYNRLLNLPSLQDVMQARGWIIGKGYHKRDGTKAIDPRPLNRFPYMPTHALNSPSPLADTNALQPIPIADGVASLGNISLYEGPRILFTDGTTVQMEIRAAYADIPFCFSSGVGALSFVNDPPDIAKFVTCYLRSSLAKYWLMLTSYTAQTERARVTLAEIKTLPLPLWLFDPAADKPAGLSEFSQYLNALENAQLLEASDIEAMRTKVDDLVFDLFALTANERTLIRDMVDLNAESLQPTSYTDLFTPLQRRPGKSQISAYTGTLEGSLRAWSRSSGGTGGINAGILAQGGTQIPLDVVHVRLDKAKSAKDDNLKVESANAILAAISKRIPEGDQVDFFKMPNSMFVWGNDIYIVKPRRLRFWTKSAALRDADELYSSLSSGWKNPKMEHSN